MLIRDRLLCITTSASFPAPRVPIRSPRPHTSAAVLVPATIASIADRPAWTSSGISAKFWPCWIPTPASVPVTIRTPAASGATTDRDDLQRALAAARAGLIDVLLVYRVDRFSRNLRDMVTLLDELDQCGVAFRSATEPFDTSTPMGRMLVQMLGMFAQFERDTIIDRVINGMERKAAKGLWKGGRRPFGYTVNPDTHRLVPNTDESPIVRLIFRLYTQDRLGSKVVARVLNERGHRTTTGGTWSAYQVLRVLSNRIYIGELSFREITVDECHTPLVDTETFEDAQRLLAERGEDHAHRRANGSDYQLTGLMRCPQCAKAMIGTRATGKNKT